MFSNLARRFSASVSTRRTLLLATISLGLGTASAEAQQYWNTNGLIASLTAPNWGATPAGPFSTAYVAGTPLVFSANSLITNVDSTDVGNMTVTNAARVTWTLDTSTVTTGGAVRTMDVGAGGILDFRTLNFSTNPGTGLVKSGSGILFSANANAYTGGFTLNAGTMIVGNDNALGNGGVLAINGGTLAANAARNLSGKFTNILVGGNFTFGGVTANVTSGNAAVGSSLTFSSTVDLGATTRTMTIGGSGVYTLGGVISGTAPTTGLSVNSTNLGTGVLVLSGANTYTGPTTVTNGVLRLSNVDALSGGYGATGGTSALSVVNSVVELGAGNFLRSLGTGTDQVQITGGASGFGAFGAARTLNFNGDGSTVQWGSASFSPTTLVLNATTSNNQLTLVNGIDLNAATRTVAVNANVAEISGDISTSSGTAGLTKLGNGTLILSGANTYTGTTTITAGTLQVGNGISGSLASAGSSPILFNGGSGALTIKALNAGSSLTMSAVTIASGDVTLQSTYGTSGNAELTFSTLPGRAAGTTRNYVVSGGSNGSTNKIVVTGTTANSFIDQGTFFGGLGFAWNDAGGFVRAINYTTDSGAATSGATASLASTTHQEITGAISNQTNATFTTLKIVGANSNIVLDPGQILTVNAILKAGNNAATINGVSGGTGIMPGFDAELVIRNNQSGDTLTMSTPILANGTNSVTKSGPGALTITATTSGTYTGGTIINAGTINIQGALASGSDAPLGTGPITINSGTLFLSRNTLSNNIVVGTGIITQGNSFGSVLNGNIVVNGVLTTLLNSGTGNIAYNGNISGPGSILHLGTRQDANTFLAGTNTYAGTTTINGALRFAKQVSLYNNNLADWTANKIIVGNGGLAIFNVGGAGEFTSSDIATLSSMGTATGGFTNGSFLGINTASGSFTYGDVIANTNGGANEIGLHKLGNNTLTLTGTNTYTGATFLSQGTLSVSSASNLGNANPLVFNGGTLQVTGTAMTNLGSHVPTFIAARAVLVDIADVANTFTISQVLSQTTSGLTKTGQGTLSLTNNSTYTGVTSVNAGVLLLNHPNALPGGIGVSGGTGALTFNGGVLGLGNGDFTRSLAAAGTVTAATFSNNGGWAAYNANRVVNLGGASDPISWGTAGSGLNSRTLILGASTATHTLDFQNPLDLGTATRTVQVNDGAAATDGILSGVLSGGFSGALTKTGAGTLVLTGANTYSGTTTVSAGTLKAGVVTVPDTSGALGINSPVVMADVAGATLDITGFNTAIGSLSGGGSTGGNVTLGAATLTMGGDNTNPLAFAGAISGNGAITKIGIGTQILSGTNVYLGSTTVSAGKLVINGDNSAATGAVSVSALATLGGSGIVGGLTTVASTGIVAPGNSAGNLTFANGVNLSAGGVYSWELGTLSTSNPGIDFDTITVSSGNLTLGGTSALTLDFNLVSGSDPNSADPFWTSSKSWKIIDVAAPGVNAGNLNLSTITNASYANGNFTTTVGSGADLGDIFLVFTTSVPVSSSVWQGASSDNWTAAPSWTGSVPNSATAEAQFTTTGGAIANLDVDQTVNKLTFNATTSNDYTISGPGKLTLAGGTPSISLAATNTGDHTVAVNLDLATDTTITVNGGSLSLDAPTNATLGSNVTATVASGATLNLGGAGNALSNGTTTHANVTNNGTLTATTAGKRVGNISGTGTTTVNTTGATLTANHVRQAGLTIGAGNNVTVAANGGDSGVSRVTALSINATGQLDLNNNDLIVDNGNLAAVTLLLKTGLDITGAYGGGPGITSTTFATNPLQNTALGVATNAELGYATFSGQAVDANDILVKYTYFGDADLNGVVDTATDFDLYITGLTSGGSLVGWLYGDFDYNGTVDSATDFDLYITGLTSQSGALLTAGSAPIQAVPEPGTLVLGGLALLGLAGVKLRRKKA